MGEVEIGGFWDRTLADAFARGSLFSALAVHLWRATCCGTTAGCARR